MNKSFVVLVSLLVIPTLALAQQEAIESAMSAGPASISAEARILDWQMNELRAGDNGWTCLPDRPDSPGNDPWCMNEPWLELLHAYMNKAEFDAKELGWAYMLMGDSPTSNIDPYATEPTEDNEWVENVGAHLMLLVPGQLGFDKVSHDPHNGGPWVMWPNTPYAHIMIPIDSQHMAGHDMEDMME
ncbi:MAG: hypothetical protein PVF33_09900 [Candidatus Latescibacterota bacterium]|jgi:hypothetical protein